MLTPLKYLFINPKLGKFAVQQTTTTTTATDFRLASKLQQIHENIFETILLSFLIERMRNSGLTIATQLQLQSIVPKYFFPSTFLHWTMNRSSFNAAESFPFAIKGTFSTINLPFSFFSVLFHSLSQNLNFMF